MSAPNTNIERQQKNHKGPIIGISLALAVAAILLLFYVFYEGTANDGVEGADSFIDGRTGEVVDEEAVPLAD